MTNQAKGEQGRFPIIRKKHFGSAIQENLGEFVKQSRRGEMCRTMRMVVFPRSRPSHDHSYTSVATSDTESASLVFRYCRQNIPSQDPRSLSSLPDWSRQTPGYQKANPRISNPPTKTRPTPSAMTPHLTSVSLCLRCPSAFHAQFASCIIEFLFSKASRRSTRICSTSTSQTKLFASLPLRGVVDSSLPFTPAPARLIKAQGFTFA